MDWDRLRVFHAVVDAKSLTGAGAVLSLSQPAVSRQISNLENDLKVRLFNRHARGLVLTEEGEILYKAVKDIFFLLNLAQNKIEDTQCSVTGTLKIATTVAVGTVWLPPRLKRFTKKYPNINIQFILNDGETDFSTREADVAICFSNSNLSASDFIIHDLFDVKLNVYGSKEYFDTHGKPSSTAELTNHKLIVYGYDTLPPASYVNILLKLGAKIGDTRAPYIQMANAFGILECVKNGLGLALLAEYIAKDHEGLVPIFCNIINPTDKLVLVYPREVQNLKKVSAFLQFLREETEELR